MKGKLFALVSLMMVLGLMVSACGQAATQAPPATEQMAEPTEAMAEATEPMAEPTATESTMVGGIDCAGVNSGDTLSVMYQWSGAEEEKFNTIAKPFVDACGVTIRVLR